MKTPSRGSTTRRRFLQQSATAAVAAMAFPHLIASSARGAAGQVSPGNRITVGLIGAGPQGVSDMKGFLADPAARVVAVCDVKDDRLALAQNAVNEHYQNQDCAKYHDFRELIARKDIDAVIIATPDHWHVVAALAAVRTGKDVYVEKPLGLSIAETQALRAELRKRQRVFQFGTQQRSSANFRRACELVRNGRIGRLKHINVWCIGSVPGGSTAPAPVPPGLDYDFWLGPAPAKPYRERLCDAAGDRKTWWFNSDYALGFIAGWGVHPIDIAYWGCPELMAGPLEVQGTGTIPTEGACDTATEWDINFKSSAGVTLNFRGLPIANNNNAAIGQHHPRQDKYGRTRDHGTVFEGTDGWVLVDRSHIAAHPESLLKENPDDYRVKLPRSAYHAQNFLESIRSRKAAIANIDEAFQSDALCHLSHLALKTGRKLTWDPRAERFVRDPAADRLLACRAMRKPWTL
ncbi:MAG: Gfo/Idh/MocA family oxidoreductase [Opitutaceae bacterium]|nr:Gfo/Idh/MocA family oxidoreductase [Opitutaceae bacterium]